MSRFERITADTPNPDRFERIGGPPAPPASLPGVDEPITPRTFERITPKAKPDDGRPWYEAEWNPSWAEGWNEAVTTLEDNFKRNLTGPISEGVKSAAKNPFAIAEAVTEFAQQTPGFIGGIAGGLGRVVAEIGKGDYDLNSLYGKFHETMAEAQQGITDAIRVYEPRDREAADNILKALFLPVEKIPEGFNEAADSEGLTRLMGAAGMSEGAQNQFKGAMKFAGDALGLVAQGKVMHAAKEGKAEPSAKGVAAEKLDTTFAKDEILTRMAKERAATSQRPLDRLVKAEGEVAGGEYAKRQADLEAAFGTRRGESRYQTEEFGGKLEDARKQQRIDEQTAADMEKFQRGAPLEPPKVETVPSGSIAPPTESGLRPPTITTVPAEGMVETGRWVEPTVPIERRQTTYGPGGEKGFAERRSPAAMRLPTDRRTAPGVQIPEFANTNEAVAFGEKAAPEQIARMQIMLEDSRTKNAKLREDAKAMPDPVAKMQMMQAGMDEATRGQFIREALEAARGEHPAQAKMRKLGDIAKDVNTALGKKGAVGDVGGMSPDQLAAYERLTRDYLVIRRNAKRLGKSVEDYLKGLKVDPAVAAAMNRNADALLAHASAVYGADTLKRYEEAATQEPREGKYAGSVNLTKQDISQAGKQLEMAMAAEHPKITVPLEETEARGAEAFATPKRAAATMRRLEKLVGGKLTGEMQGLREVNAAHAKMFGDIVEQFRKGEIGQEEFNTAVANFNEQYFRLDSDLASEVGRALRARREVVAGEQIPQILAKYKKLNPRQQAMVDAVTKEWMEGTLTAEKLQQFEKMMPDPKWSDYLKQIWYNNILSGPVTHMRNVAGNTLWGLAQPVFRGVSGAIDPVWAAVSRQPRTRYMGEVLPLLAGYRRGFTRGAVRAKDMFRKGYLPGMETKWEMEMGSAATAFERSPNAALRKMAPAFTQFTRALHAMDVWAKAMAFDGQLAALARRAANQKGLKGAEKFKFEQAYKLNPPESALESTKRFADNATFMDHPDPVTSGVITIRNIPVVGTGLRYTVIPFVNTIGNLLKRGVELTPGLGIVKELASAGMRKGIEKLPAGRTKALGKEWAESRQYNIPDIAAKQTIGTMLSLYILHKASQGRITGPMPDTPNERELWYRNNIQPWSIRFGGTDSPEGLAGVADGTWYSYRWAEPFNTPIAAAAQFYDDIVKGKGGAKNIENWFELSGDMWQNLIDGAYFSGLQRFLDPYSNKRELLPRFAAGWVPYSGLMRTVARTYEAMNEGQVAVREGNPWAEAFAQVIPNLYGKVPAKLTVYGEESVRPGGVLQQWLPIQWADANMDAVEQALMRVGLYPGLPRKTVSYRNREYNIPDDVYRDYCIDYGSALKEKFWRVVDRRDFDTKTPDRQFDLLNTKRNEAGDVARRHLIRYMRRAGLFNPDNEVEPRR